MSKNVQNNHQKCTKSEKEYVKGIIHNLSFQRLTDQEIVQWLHDQKQIDMSRSTVSRVRNQVELKAAKWYIELKNSGSTYIAAYKERIDSLFSYQKKLHEIIESTKKPEIKIRCISELHSIEIDIFNLWKQLPNLDVTDPKDKRPEPNIDMQDLIGLETDPSMESQARVASEDDYVQCSHQCKRWFKKRIIRSHESKCIPEIE